MNGSWQKGLISAMVGLLTALCGCNVAVPGPAEQMQAEIAQRRARRVRSNDLLRESLIARRKGEMEQAQELLTRSVAEDERNAPAWTALGVVAFELDELYDSARALHRAARLAPRSYEPRYNLGIVFETAGVYEKAITEYETALDLSPGHTEVMENLARCYISCGRKLEEAHQLIRRALKSENRPEWVAWLEYQNRRLEARLPASRIEQAGADVSGLPSSQPANTEGAAMRHLPWHGSPRRWQGVLEGPDDAPGLGKERTSGD